MSQGLSRRAFLRLTGAISAGMAAFGAELPKGPAPQAGVAWAQGAPTYALTYLEYAKIEKFPISGMLYGAHNQGTRAIPFTYTLIRGGGRHILFDCGYANQKWNQVYGITDYEDPKTVLGKVGVSPEQIDSVIIGHMHFDHFGNTEAFPKAKLYVQKSEMSGWVWALGLGAECKWITAAVDPEDVIDAMKAAAEGRLVLVDGDQEIAPGVQLINADDTHTFGTQMAAVNTAKGTYCLTGDACYWYENAEKMIPIGYASGSQVKQLFAIKKAKDIAGGVERLVPGHDAQVFERHASRTAGKNRIAELA
jgi:glyoxylase-like metal-dependent hydrolase (beta-lactamase superfamily II)